MSSACLRGETFNGVALICDQHQDEQYHDWLKQQADSSPSSRAVSTPVLPPAPASTLDQAQIKGLSPAKTAETSEGVKKQAGNGVGLIMPLKLPVATSPQVTSGQSVTTNHSTGEVYVSAGVPGAVVAGEGMSHV